jgi:alpha-galactosidase
MAKIVLIGAGSRNFSKGIITDVLLYPELRDCTISLMDIDKERLDLTAAFTRELVKQNGFNTKVEATTDRRKALEGADYVIVAIAVGKSRLDGQTITAKYGLPWDDTVGPNGILYGNRHAQTIVEIAHDMEELCPNAWLLNYSNPQAIICWSLNDYTKIKNVGICPNSRGGAFHLASWLHIPFEEVTYWCAGINHFSWYLEFKWKGKDAYPLLKEKFKAPGTYNGPDVGIKYNDEKGYLEGVDLVEVELFKRFGYFTNGSGGHIPEYLPYFSRTPELFKHFRLDDFVNLAKHMSARRMATEAKIKEELNSHHQFELTREFRWTIFAVNVIHSIETGVARRINLNVKNTGIITNLTPGCCVEVPCLVDSEGVHPCYIGNLPPQCAALTQTSVNQQLLAVQAIHEKNLNKFMEAVLLDPLTSSMLTIDQIEAMMKEMFDWEKQYLKGYK